MTSVHVLVPDGVDDPRRPSGGNVYDRKVCGGLAALGWSVHVHPVGRRSLAEVLRELPCGSVVLVDGLIASDALAPEAERLRVVLLLHMPRENMPLSTASAIVVTSEWTRRWLGEHYALPVFVVPPGVDAADVAPGTASGGQLLCVGAVTRLKGHDLLLEALASVDDLDWQCTCVGALDLEPEFVAGLVEHRRVCFTGPLTGPDLDRAYANADVLVLASRAETFGMVVTEALAHGLPVIARDVGGVSEALGRAADGSRPGVLVPPDDSQALGQALRCWLSDAARRQELRAAARSRREELSDWAQTSRSLSAALAEVAG